MEKTQDTSKETRHALAQHAKWVLQSQGVAIRDDEASALARQLLRLAAGPPFAPVKPCSPSP